MIKVIKASMRSCLGAFGLGKVVPKVKKRQWVYCYNRFDGSGNCIMFRGFFYLPLKQAHHFEKRIA